MPPDAKVVHIADFDLKNIEKYFTYADFERKISKRKVNEIAKARINKKYKTYNNYCNKNILLRRPKPYQK